MTINGVAATYDALGQMVEFSRSGTNYEVIYSPTGNKFALMNGQALQKAFVPLSGNAMAVYTSGGLDHYRHSDWLGSARLFTSATQSQTPLGEAAYSPYGETYAQTGLSDFSFTGMNDDADPTNPALVYDFPAREYGIQGRWSSPDPAGLDAVDPAEPQSWNRYAYVNNNPLAATDPTGLLIYTGGAVLINPADGGPCLWCDAIIGIIDVVADILSLFGHHHTPHAAPAPPGGYGAGIDPFGNSIFEQVPLNVGVQIPCVSTGPVGGPVWSETCGDPRIIVSGSGPSHASPDFWLAAGLLGATGLALANNGPGTPNGQQLSLQANQNFNYCISGGGFSAIGRAAFDETQNGTEGPSANDFVLNATKEILDLHKECLGTNPTADLARRYRGLFHAGDAGVNPIGGFWGWVTGQ